jgi:hypothetical protein
MAKGNKPTGGKKDKATMKKKSKVKVKPSGSIFNRQGDSTV